MPASLFGSCTGMQRIGYSHSSARTTSHQSRHSAGNRIQSQSYQIGYETCAYIGLYLKESASLETVINALAHIPEVVECHYTNEDYDLFIKVYAKSNEHLQTILHSKLRPLGLSHSRIILSFKQILQKQITLPSQSE